MTRLLVSVRNAEEALIAADNGADIIDIKEPRVGALGCAEPQVIGDVVSALCARYNRQATEKKQIPPISLAMGELVDAAAFEKSELPDQVWSAIRYAKAGCRDCERSRWPDLWSAWQSSLPSHVDTVAVGYADHLLAGCPRPEDVLELATDGGATGFLLDTFAKKSSHLFDFFSSSRLESLIACARRNALTMAIAGSLKICDLPRALAAKPDVVGVRGAACATEREGDLCGSRVGELVAATHELAPLTAS